MAEIKLQGKLTIGTGPAGKDGTMTFEDLTEDQKATLKGDKGERGEQGLQGPKGDKGETGATGKDGTNGKDADMTEVEALIDSKLEGFEPSTGSGLPEYSIEDAYKVLTVNEEGTNVIWTEQTAGTAPAGNSYLGIDDRQIETDANKYTKEGYSKTSPDTSNLDSDLKDFGIIQNIYQNKSKGIGIQYYYKVGNGKIPAKVYTRSFVGIGTGSASFTSWNLVNGGSKIVRRKDGTFTNTSTQLASWIGTIQKLPISLLPNIYIGDQFILAGKSKDNKETILYGQIDSQPDKNNYSCTILSVIYQN